jgi:arylsulfatase
MSSEAKKNRSHLPMPNTQRRTLITYDAKDPNSKFPPIEQLPPTPGVPRVVYTPVAVPPPAWWAEALIPSD